MFEPARSVMEVCRFLAGQADIKSPVAGDVPAMVISHGVRCATHLRRSHPDDLELQVAGLLHDVGLLLVPGDELGHPQHGANYVRPLFGDRCAQIIALHVDAQRYLEMTVEDYVTTPPPTAPFAAQPQAMTDEEARAFSAHPLFHVALDLRDADDHSVGDLLPLDIVPWRRMMGMLAKRSG